MFFVGAFVAMLNGLIFPVLSILIARTLTSLGNFRVDPVQARKDCDVYGLLYLMLAIASFFIHIIETAIFYPIG